MTDSNKLSTEQQKIIEAVQKGQNIFVTGVAGTGKSFVLKKLKEIYGKRLQITASTGIAAVNVGGITLHSWAGLGLGEKNADELADDIMFNRRVLNRIRNAEILAIDEISMIKADLFDLFNEVMQIIRGKDLPFGGLQILLFGDFLQLPPVMQRGRFFENAFIFESYAWQEADLQTFFLKKPFRQTDQKFLQLLHNIRLGEVTEKDLEILESRTDLYDSEEIKPTQITTHNNQADIINKNELHHLKTKEEIFYWREEGNKQRLEFLKKNCLVLPELTLKIGAQVMMLKNTFQEQGVVNGSLGVIKDFSIERYPFVEFHNGQILEIKQEEWIVEEDYKTVASIKQIPLRLAWAITVHKSQGMTLEKIRCQLGNAFSEGQVYVALSRVKTLDGLFLDSFNPNLIRVNQKVVEFYRNLEK